MLNSAVAQSQGRSPGVNAGNFRGFMLKRAGSIDLDAAKKDVERFLEDKSELRLFSKEVLAAAINYAARNRGQGLIGGADTARIFL